MSDLKVWPLTWLKRSQTEEFDYTSINLLGYKLRKNIWPDLRFNEKRCDKDAVISLFIYL